MHSFNTIFKSCLETFDIYLTLKLTFQFCLIFGKDHLVIFLSARKLGRTHHFTFFLRVTKKKEDKNNRRRKVMKPEFSSASPVLQRV